MSIKRVNKVTTFITRRAPGGAQLLLFDHPLAGRQLPAGTVELGEELETAVLREAAEETGLTALRLVSLLGHFRQPLPEETQVVARMTKLFNSPASDASSAGYGLGRGELVQVLDHINGFSLVECDPLDWRQEPPLRGKRVRGYVRSSLLTREVERYLYHLEVTEETAHSWEKFADGHLFELFWVPLQPRPQIHPDQAGSLVQVYDQLLTAVGL